jgi:Ca2+-binding RTX toxin-like protein
MVVFDAAVGQANNLTISTLADGRVRLDDVVAVTPGTNCTAIDSTAVACKNPPKGLWIELEDGDDTVTTSANLPARLSGGPGNDELRGGPAADVLDGGPGADTVYGGFGIDEVSYENATTAVAVDLDGIGGDDGAPGEHDSIALDIENLRGGPFNDTLTGNPLDNQISGGPGNDVINGGAGNDLLVPGDGDDTVIGGPGVDRADYQEHTAGIIADLDGAIGDDGSPGERDTLGADVENLTGTPYDDVLIGNDGANEINGLAGQNIIKGLGGPDKLTAGSVIYGGDGDDTLTGSGAQSYLLGEAGEDTIVGKTAFDLIDGGPNADTCTGEKLFNCEN